METKQTYLQKTVSYVAVYLAKHIDEAIKNGAKITPCGAGVNIDGVFIAAAFEKGKDGCIIVQFESETIANALRPSEMELIERAESLRAELNEIENQLKEREANDETNND